MSRFLPIFSLAAAPAMILIAAHSRPIEEHALTMPVKITRLAELNDTFNQGRGDQSISIAGFDRAQGRNQVAGCTARFTRNIKMMRFFAALVLAPLALAALVLAPLACALEPGVPSRTAIVAAAARAYTSHE